MGRGRDRRSTRPRGGSSCRINRPERTTRRPGFVVPTGRLPFSVGRVIFIRRVSPAGTVSVLSQSFRVGKRHEGLDLRLVIDTGRGRLTAYLNGRVLNRWPDKLLNE